jgi:hypothetical protein
VTLLARASAALERSAIAHALIGAGALAAHGVARATADFDLLTTRPATLDEATWRELRVPGVRVEIRHGDELDPLRGVVRVSSSGERPVDVVVGRAAWQEAVIQRAQPARVGDATLRIVTAADLILLKLYAGGPQDAWDIDQLLDRVPSAAGEVHTLVTALPTDCAALWERIRRARAVGG